MNNPENSRPPLPPFDQESAIQKVRLAEDAWNTRNPERVSLAYTSDSVWRNRSEFGSVLDLWQGLHGKTKFITIHK